MKRTPAALAGLVLPIILIATTTFVTVSGVQAKAPPLTKKASTVEFYSQSTNDGSAQTTCTSGGCANGLEVTWPADTCYQGDRYLPITVIWTQAGNKVATSEWPLTAPCSTGLEFGWDTNNHLNMAKWLGAGKSSEAGLAICFQSKTECNAGHCVTAGCLPGKTTGVDIFFQGGDTPATAEWLANGKASSPITLSGSPDSLFWYGTTPPASPYTTTGTNTAPSTSVTITGRTSSSKPQIIKDTAPNNADGVDMVWYLPKYDPVQTRGCHQYNGVWYTSPPLALAYTTNGQLNSPITAPTCAAPSGTPWPYSDIDFSWTQTGSGLDLTLARPLPYDTHIPKCQGSLHGGSGYPTGAIPQPPAGTNGVTFTFSHDTYSSTCWTNGSTVLKAMTHPGHPRLDVLSGKG